MGATEDLLRSMPDEVGEDGTVYLTIDPDTRVITVPSNEKTFGVETDKDSERKYFRCPRIVGDNIDLSQHKIYISYVSTKSKMLKIFPKADGSYWCDDVAVDGDYITFSWKLSGNVFKEPGFVAFKVLAKKTDGDVLKTRWNTAPAFGTVLFTVPDGESVEERYPDIVTQLLERMDAVEAIATEEAMQGYVNEYLGEHPVQLDETLTDNTKAAPAGIVGELKSDLGELIERKVTLSTTRKAFVIPKGTTFTISTSDGSVLPTNRLLVYKDSTSAFFDYWGISSSYGSKRTVTNTSYDILYVSLESNSDVDIVVTIPDESKFVPQFEKVKSDLENQSERISFLNQSVTFIITTQNLYDRSKATPKKYVSVSNGNLSDGDNFTASDFIDISSYDDITLSKTHIACWYKKDKSFLSAVDGMNTGDEDATIAVPSEAYYIRASFYTSNEPTVQIGYGKISRNHYLPFGMYYSENQVYKDNVIVVDASGKGDYTSFTEAIYRTKYSGIDVIVKAGTYDITAEYETLFGKSIVDNLDDSTDLSLFQYGVYIDNRKVTFESGSHLVCDWTGHTVDGTHRFSALAIRMNTEIIGLDIDCTGTFYVIHDDYGEQTIAYTNVYRNCRVVGHNLTNSNCIGGGVKKYSRHIIDNCYFNNNGTGTTVRYHNTNAEGAEAEVYVSNSYFNNALKFNYYGNQTSKMKAYVNSCEAKSIVVDQESPSYTTNNIELFKWNNKELVS